jgi:heat shock protein HtpX
MNYFKTATLMGLMTLLLVIVGYASAEESGMLIGLAISIAINFGTYWFSASIVLFLYEASEIKESEYPELYGLVRDLSAHAGLPMPKVCIVKAEQANAFATGRNSENAVVCFTTGILNLLSRDELAGVIAHELSHIKHSDILLGTIVAAMVGTISFMSRGSAWRMGRSERIGRRGRRGRRAHGNAIFLIIAPIAATIIQMAISRAREYKADEAGAKITGNPAHLASALRKLNDGVKKMPMDSNPAAFHLLIVSPLKSGFMARLFSTHPPIEKRIAKLEQMKP